MTRLPPTAFGWWLERADECRGKEEHVGLLVAMARAHWGRPLGEEPGDKGAALLRACRWDAGRALRIVWQSIGDNPAGSLWDYALARARNENRRNPVPERYQGPAPEGELFPEPEQVLEAVTADPKARALWQAVLGELLTEVARPSYETFLKETIGVAREDSRLTVVTPSPFVAEYLQQKLYSLVKRTVEKVAKEPLDVRFKAASLRGVKAEKAK